jgi:hypothetical protein
LLLLILTDDRDIRWHCRDHGLEIDRDTEIMMQEVIKYLRDLAQTCTRLARACPHVATSHGLEEIALDLMAKAKELEDIQSN